VSQESVIHRVWGLMPMSRKRSSSIGAVRLVLVAVLWALSSASPALAQDNAASRDDLVVLTGRADISEGETVGDVVIFDGPVNIAGTVDGDVVAFNGRVTVTGTVRGDVASFNGRVIAEDGAQITGDVRSRPEAQISSGAEVGGTVGGVDFERVDDALAAARFGVWFAISISALILVFLFVWLFPRGADATALAGRSRTGAAVGWGLLLFFGLPIISVLLLVTVVGIPLGLVLLLALAPIYVLAYTVAAYFLGRRIIGPPRSRFLAALVGIIVLRILALIPFVGGLTWFAATVFGLGLLLVAARARKEAEPTPQPATTPA
jgi:hypothetical protein